MNVYSEVQIFFFFKWGFPGGSDGKESACSAGDPGSIPGQEDPLDKEMKTHSSILAWRIPRTQESDRLQSMDVKESDTTWSFSQLLYCMYLT